MLTIYIFALLIHAVFSSTPCKDGVEIKSKETNNPEDLIGNWTYVYHWDNVNKFKKEFVDDNQYLSHCPEISIAAIAPDYVKEKETECAHNVEPFKWSDARLTFDAPLMKMKGAILFMGDTENWLMSECKNMVRVVLRKVSDDYMVMINPGGPLTRVSEMIARKVPTLEELKCIAHNVDVGKGMSGCGLCY